MSYNYAVVQHGALVELYIDRGEDMQEENKAIFDKLLAHPEAVEKGPDNERLYGANRLAKLVFAKVAEHDIAGKDRKCRRRA